MNTIIQAIPYLSAIVTVLVSFYINTPLGFVTILSAVIICPSVNED